MLTLITTFVFLAIVRAQKKSQNDGNTNSEYYHKIEPFSFDIQKFEYPLEYLKMGTCIALKDTIKVLPKVENRFGGLFMSQPVETN